jgi:hypothetical protein
MRSEAVAKRRPIGCAGIDRVSRGVMRSRFAVRRAESALHCEAYDETLLRKLAFVK